MRLLASRTIVLFLVSVTSAAALAAPSRIPAPFLGEWDESVAACKAGDWGEHMTIEPGRILLHEAEGIVRGIKVDNARSVTVTLDYSETDGRKTYVERFVLSLDNKALTWITGGDRFLRVKCTPKNSRQ